MDFGQTVWESRSQKPEIGSQKLIFRQQTGKTGRLGAAKSSLKILGELLGGLGRSGFGPNYRIINSQPCCLRKKSPCVRFCEISAPFRDCFDEIRTFGDNPVIADCPKSNNTLWIFYRFLDSFKHLFVPPFPFCCFARIMQNYSNLKICPKNTQQRISVLFYFKLLDYFFPPCFAYGTP